MLILLLFGSSLHGVRRCLSCFALLECRLERSLERGEKADYSATGIAETIASEIDVNLQYYYRVQVHTLSEPSWVFLSARRWSRSFFCSQNSAA